jgi:hypothetical protein
MFFNKSIIGSFVSFTLTTIVSTVVIANEVHDDSASFFTDGERLTGKQKAGNYIVQLKGVNAIAHAQQIGELLPSNQLVANTGNRYNAYTPKMKAYTAEIGAKQLAVANSIDSLQILHSFKHTYNGFTVKLTDKQKQQILAHPDVVDVWEDRLEVINTANTPQFLGLTGSSGQHSLGVKGEDVIIGIIDTGIWPENPSFSDDGSYSDPSSIGWQGNCDAGSDPEFTCNNKLIGARYFGDSFSSVYDIQYTLGEFDSPRDADGHGSHTAGTAGGNEGVGATLSGVSAGTVSGIAPRARIAAYKACWNSDYTNPDGGSEAGCFYGDTMAAIDAAVTDGVDVINYSIGGSLTDLTIPSTAAMLNASAAGVFVAVSAGNSGPEKETVGTPAPWVTSVAASTYDGISVIVGKALDITSGELSGSSIMSVPAGFSPANNGLTGELALAQPVEACSTSPLTNPDELLGKIAVIARGSCAFTEKFISAQNAGATGVLIYTTEGTSTFSMGGSDPAVTITGSMISYEDGQALTDSIALGSTSVVFTDDAASGDSIEVGNTIASFSSRGPNLNTYDIIKPDITAPGVRILAATTSEPMFAEAGETFRYLQGTSMSSPHIAGIAALFKESNSSWSPAQIKSAMMTTSRQNLTKEDSLTPADPYDFGAGHVDPVSALDPGLLFDINTSDYLGFLCGQDKDNFVENYGLTCADLAAAGFSNDASQLNLPSIAIAELLAAETISRTVTNATSIASSYTATIEAPFGFNVTLQTFDAAGIETDSSTLDIDANGTASFSLNFTKNDAVENQVWQFGSITWADSSGHVVRLPLAVKATPAVQIDVPELISGDLTRGRFRYPVQMLYSGQTSIDYAGLVAPFDTSGTVEADPAQTFEFLGTGTNYHLFEVPAGTQVARFSLADGLINVEGSDLDLYLYRCISWSCTEVDASLNAGSNETVVQVNPEPAGDITVGNVYLTMIHGYSTGDAPSADYTMLGWLADSAQSSTRVMSSRRAIQGRFNYTTIMTRGLPTGTTYMGAVTYYNEEGEAQGTTVLELNN